VVESPPTSHLIQQLVKFDNTDAGNYRLDPFQSVVIVLAVIRAEAPFRPSPMATVQRLNIGVAEWVTTSLRMPAASRTD